MPFLFSISENISCRLTTRLEGPSHTVDCEVAATMETLKSRALQRRSAEPRHERTITKRTSLTLEREGAVGILPGEEHERLVAVEGIVGRVCGHRRLDDVAVSGAISDERPVPVGPRVRAVGDIVYVVVISDVVAQLDQAAAGVKVAGVLRMAGGVVRGQSLNEPGEGGGERRW